MDISIDRRNPNVMFAALWEAYRLEYTMSSGGPGSGLYKSTDGGETWTDITRNPGLPKQRCGREDPRREEPGRRSAVEGRLNNRLATLLSMVNHGDGKPIGNAQPVFKDLTAELKVQTDRLQQALARDLAAFNVEAKRLGLEPVSDKPPTKP